MSLKSYTEFLNEDRGSLSILNEGGAYGHLSHPFEDFSLTMSDIQDMIEATVTGAFGPENFTQEKCVSGDTILYLQNLGPISIKELVEKKYEDSVLTQTIDGTVCYMPIVDWVDNGETEEWLVIETEDGKIIKVTPNHRIFANGVELKADELNVGDLLVTIN